MHRYQGNCSDSETGAQYSGCQQDFSSEHSQDHAGWMRGGPDEVIRPLSSASGSERLQMRPQSVAPSLVADPSPGLVNASQAFTPLPTNGRGSFLKFDRSLNFVGSKGP